MFTGNFEGFHDSVEAQVLDVLDHVSDPEIPLVSIRQLGMLYRIGYTQSQHIEVVLRPTFVGCPALDLIRSQAQAAIASRLGRPLDEVDVIWRFDDPWTHAKISAVGRINLEQSGISPPSADDESNLGVRCPYCHGLNIRLTSHFGSTRCRQQYYCPSCHTPFEGIKPLGSPKCQPRNFLIKGPQ
jgi:ring-1,2-phenylacetyl-CoA epoxidase subunit PaaD